MKSENEKNRNFALVDSSDDRSRFSKWMCGHGGGD